MGWLALGAQAHPMPESRVWIDTQPTGLQLTLQLPLNRLEFAFGQALADAPAQVLARHRAALARYVLAHVRARNESQEWQIELSDLQVRGNDAQAELEATLLLKAPAGTDPRRVTLWYDVITHEVKTHRALVFLRQDWMGGQGAQPPRPVAQLDTTHTAWRLDLGPVPASSVTSVRALLAQGAWHIAEGVDHLTFLVLLMLVAPLQAVRSHGTWCWGPSRPATQGVRQVIWVVSAFTLGHSLTLALGSLGGMSWPAAWVEVGVALTLIMAAIHAWRPVWRQGEAAIAATFGWVHGMAFSASLSGAGLSAWQMLQAWLAFNLGIELMQLVLLGLLAPVLWFGTRRWLPGYHRLRLLASGVGGGMACFWLWERVQVL